MTFSRIALIHNPCAGRGRQHQASIGRFAAMLRENGRRVEVFATEYPNHATQLAREAVALGCDLIMAHGGDGTVNEVLQALVGTEATLGFWPGGTANVLAAEVRTPHRIPDLVGQILAGRVKRVTVGRANERYFLLMAGVGLDAAIAGGVEPEVKRRLGKGAYAVSMVKFLLDWSLEPFRVFMDGEEVVGRFVVAGNARSYGGGFRLTPLANLDDPCLDLCIFSSASRWDYLAYATAALFGSHRGMRGVTYRKVRRAHITSAGRSGAPVQLDGEVACELPLVLEALPAAVNLLM